MKDINDLTYEKIADLTNYMLSRLIKPDIIIEKVTELTDKEIDIMKNRYGVEAVILDVDETLRSDLNLIPKCNDEWIEKLRGKLKVIILSNGEDRKLQQYFNEKGIVYITRASKPAKRSFKKACEKLNVSPDKVMVIGDSVYSDIYGGKKNNMWTVWVRDVEDKER